MNHKGYRQKQKASILKNGFNSKEEVLEALLFFSIARKGTKDIACSIMKKFPSIRHFLFANKRDILAIEGIGENTTLFLEVIKSMCNYILLEKIENRNLIGNWSDLIEYLSFHKIQNREEEVSILLLNAKNYLILEEKILGTTTFIKLQPRDILFKCLQVPCTKVIFVHNHPSGISNPSREDIEVTRKMKNLLAQVNIELYDHIIIATDGHFSFRSSAIL